jgi:hypothetical protein
MRTFSRSLTALTVVIASACAPLPEDAGSDADLETGTAVQALNAVSGAFSGAAMGVAIVRMGSARCTGVMIDAVTALTAGACNGPRARDFTVQVGADVQTASQVRFSASGVTLLRLPRVFTGMANTFARRVSMRTAAQMDGHTLSCFAYNAAGQLVQASMRGRNASGAVELQPISSLNVWDTFDRGALCMDVTANSQDLDALPLSASSASNLATAAAGGGGIGAWTDFHQSLTWPQMALVLEAQGTNACLAFDYAGSRIARVACDQADPRQGLYQETAGSGVRLRGADSSFCVANVSNVLRFQSCQGAAPTGAQTFTLQWTGSAYRMGNQGRCVSATATGVTLQPCSASDATQRFTMRLSTY